MSRVGELGKEFNNLPAVIASYQEDLDQAETILPIKGKMLDDAFKEQCAWPVYYATKKAEVKTLVKFMESQVAKVRGQKTKKLVENHSRDLGERLIDKYINADEDYLKINAVLLEVEEIYDMFSGIMDAFDKRGFALRDITAAKINELHRDIL